MLEVSQQSLAILGSTGSIGKSTLQVVAANPKLFNVFALSARHNWRLLLEQCTLFKPRYAALQDEKQAQFLEQALKDEKIQTTVVVGDNAIDEVAAHASVDTVVAAIVGVAGLSSTLSAINAGKRVLLANKESLVCAGNLLMQAVRDNNAELLALDSEHNAMFQCFSTPLQHLSLIHI